MQMTLMHTPVRRVSLGPRHASGWEMVLSVDKRPRATVRERRRQSVVRLAAVPALLS